VSHTYLSEIGELMTDSSSSEGMVVSPIPLLKIESRAADLEVLTASGKHAFHPRISTRATSSEAVERLDDDEKDGICLNDTIGRLQNLNVINEPSLSTATIEA
jgi:hypothetical protein